MDHDDFDRCWLGAFALFLLVAFRIDVDRDICGGITEVRLGAFECFCSRKGRVAWLVGEDVARFDRLVEP